MRPVRLGWYPHHESPAAGTVRASAILAEAVQSFLGLGLVDDPSWGQMLNQAVRSSTFNWWMAVFPGGAIFLTVFAYNLIGEALRDAIAPNLSQEV